MISINNNSIITGSNRYCLDKNYAGVLIIWDRMFGTFEAEKDDEEIVYGLVDQPQYFNPFKHQVRVLLLFLDKETMSITMYQVEIVFPYKILYYFLN